ncbi:acyl-CoA dehydrogenase family protein [Streptomyces sp. NPDC056161]|uniref:acyl-CoA dehydrogenase family protein n=1 Tax=Streptomyces sp. NPDC056161 TaxID=3345732 RepID=UPI0035DE6673
MSTLDILPDEERFVVRTVRDFVDKEVRPVVRELEHTDTYPADLIERMKQLGVFGLAVPEEYGGTPVSTPCYVLVTEEVARGWMSLAGAMGGHTGVAKFAAREADAGHRVDMEAGMAKLFASETAMQIALNAVRIHGGYGYSAEFDVERYFRDAPLMIVGEGTNEIQRNVIASQLIRRGGLDS